MPEEEKEELSFESLHEGIKYDLDLNDKNIKLNSAPSSDGDYNGIIISATVDENTQGFGNLLHVDSDGHFVDAHVDCIQVKIYYSPAGSVHIDELYSISSANIDELCGISFTDIDEKLGIN